jgi:TolB-like protein
MVVVGAVTLVVAGLVGWELHVGAGRELFGFGTVPKPVEVASLTAPNRLAKHTSVAVLPFKNLSGDAGQDFFSDGITEDVITALGRFSNLLVIAKSASFPFKGSNASPAEIGRILDARYLLDGSIRRAGNRIRVTAALTEAPTGRQVWSETYDAEVDDIFAVQDDIAKRVVGAAAVKLTRFEQERALAKPTSSLAAYEYVLRGRDFFSHATRESNDEASELFQRAIDLDPNYADAYAALAARITKPSCQGGPNSARKSSNVPKCSHRRRWRWIRQRRALIACLPTSIFSENATSLRWGNSTARSKSIRATRTTMPTAGASQCGRVEPQRDYLG